MYFLQIGNKHVLSSETVFENKVCRNKQILSSETVFENKIIIYKKLNRKQLRNIKQKQNVKTRLPTSIGAFSSQTGVGGDLRVGMAPNLCSTGNNGALVP